jgi:hypothetical protein
MADPNIKIKRSSVEGKIPTADQLPLGEVALNTYDGKLFASKNVGIGTTVFVVNPWTVGTGTNTYNTYFTAGNVGIGTTNPTENLSVLGKIQINQDSSSNNRLIFRGQPSSSYRWNIDNYGSSNEFRIFREDDATSANGSVAVSISTTGTVTATKFSGDGSLLTGITAAGSGVVVQNQGSTVGTAGTLNFSTNLTASFSSGTATISLSNNPSISGILTADQVYTSNNGNGTNIRIGDDFWLGDINLENTTRFSGAQDSTKAFVVFGSSDAVALGRTGTGPLYYGGDFNVAGIVTASSFSGNASSATKLQTPRTFEIAGDVVASAISFDGTGNVSLAATIQPNSVALGGDTTGNYVASITNGSYITGGDGGSESAALTLAVDATSSNTASKVVARDASGNFSAGTITANLTGTATTATNLSDGANITTGTISDDRLPDLITSNINITSGVSTFATVKATTFEGSLTGNASSSTYATTAGVATALQNSRTFEITGDIVASPISFDGTGNVSLAATIQPNSVALGSDTTGDYVQSITGTSNQITVTGGTGESSTPTLSIPNQFTAPQDVTVTRDLQVNRDLNVSGNITIGGTTATLFSQELKVFDPDIVLGFRTDANNNDVSTDNTANHGGIAVASTEGTPLISLYDVGVGETNPATYKKFMWFKSGTFAGLGTDAWISNYAIGIGSTQVPNGVRLAAGGMQVTDNTISSPQLNISGVTTSTGGFVGNLTGTATTASIATVAQGLTGTPNITVGVVTATSFVKSGGTSNQFLKADGSVDSGNYLTTTGSGANLTGIVTSIVAGTNITISGSTGQVTINSTGGGGGGATAAPLDILEVMLFA